MSCCIVKNPIYLPNHSRICSALQLPDSIQVKCKEVSLQRTYLYGAVLPADLTAPSNVEGYQLNSISASGLSIDGGRQVLIDRDGIYNITVQGTVTRDPLVVSSTDVNVEVLDAATSTWSVVGSLSYLQSSPTDATFRTRVARVVSLKALDRVRLVSTNANADQFFSNVTLTVRRH